MRVRSFVWIAVLGLGVPLAWIGRASVVGETNRTPSAETARATPRDFESIVKATGVVKATPGSEIHVGAQLSCIVKRVHVRTGDAVERGQLLLELDARALHAQRERAMAALESAEANLRYATSDWQRQQELARSGAISHGALEVVERTLALAKASVKEGKAQVAYTRSQLADARVSSPITGIIAAVDIQEGERVPEPAGTGLVTVIDLERLELWAYVDETDIGKIEPRQTVEFGVDAYPNETFRGEVQTIHPKPEIRDNVVNYVTVVAFRPTANRTLRPEMTANVRIVLGRRPQTLSVPRRFVRNDRGQSYVMTGDGAVPERRTVMLGIRDDNYVEVTQGLKLDEIVRIQRAPDISNQDPSP